MRIALALRLSSVLAIVPIVVAQALPPLPDLPSSSPAQSPSPLPSAIVDLIDGSPSALSPTAVVPTDSPTSSGLPDPPLPDASPSSGDQGEEPEPEPSMMPAQIPPASTPEPDAASEFVDDSGSCIRDTERPRPKLGKSQVRYAVSVLLSAAAVAFSSVLYGLAYDWEPDQEHTAFRIISIVLARVLIVAAVKVSAALVASITKASPDDGALDASGAFLTWGTAIFTRLYYEGFKMTMAALEFSHNQSVWDDKLKEFLSARLVRRKLETSNGEAIEYSGEDRHVDEYLPGRLSILQLLKGGNLERKLLIITTILYFTSEISVLTANVLVLVGAFADNPENTSFFASDDDFGQCGITRSDLPVIGGLIAVQVTYALTQQPSLVPILTITAFCPRCENFPTVNKVIRQLRWIAIAVLFTWVVSLLTLPLFSGSLLPLFTGGDITLFWYVIVAPPSYHTASYKITATFTSFAAIVGTFIIIRISRTETMDTDTSP